MAPLLDPDTVARQLGIIAVEAGRYLAAVPDRSAGQVTKPDGTPATTADLESERLILDRLAASFPGVVVVAEESRAGLGAADLFFLVDPLDGTRDYLSGAGEYSVNIALVRGGRPIAAALAGPSLGRVWIAGERAEVAAFGPAGDTDGWHPAKVRAAPADGLVALASRRHGDPETEACLAGFAIAERRPVSSAVKFGLIASGEADLYIRCGPTMEWDTAAGDHILRLAGGAVVGPDRRPLGYGQAGRGFLNGPFAAMGDPALVPRIALPTR